MDRFAAVIQKQHLLNYPDGREFNGVVREYTLKHEGKYTQVGNIV